MICNKNNNFSTSIAFEFDLEINIGLKGVQIKYGRGTENADNSSDNTSVQSIDTFLTSRSTLGYNLNC